MCKITDEPEASTSRVLKVAQFGVEKVCWITRISSEA